MHVLTPNANPHCITLRPQDIPSLLPSATHALSPWMRMAVAIAHTKHLHDTHTSTPHMTLRPTVAKWGAYIRALPHSYDTIVDWSDAELAWLDDTSFIRAADNCGGVAQQLAHGVSPTNYHTPQPITLRNPSRPGNSITHWCTAAHTHRFAL